MAEDKFDPDKTPVQPTIERRRESQRAMGAIGWPVCPACKGDSSAECVLCWDEESKSFARRVPLDVAVEWLRTHPE